MLVVILLYDQLLFRPLVAWVDRFRVEQEPGVRLPQSWALTMMRRSRLIKALTVAFHAALLWTTRAGVAHTSAAEALQVCGLAVLTMLRVFILIALASLIWVPVGVWVGLRPRASQFVQPIAQFMAAFPANLLFPLAVFGIVTWKLDPDIWLSPLMILGTQWYILFNVIAGASALPAELRYAAQNFGVHGWLWWRKVALPGVLPFYVTGAITASGGSWNAAIVAELATWGHAQVRARGLGSYIAEATAAGDFHRIVLGIGTMSLFVVVINRLFWRPLYYHAERKYRLT